jgi:hypothetical protein
MAIRSEEARMNFKQTLSAFADWRDKHRPSIKTATIEVTERYARRALGLRKGDCLQFRGLGLTCIGSKTWRQRNQFRRI